MATAEVQHGRRGPAGPGVARASAALALLLSFGGAASAQQAISTGTTTGIVHDEQGLPVPGAPIEVTSTQTREQRWTTSNSGICNVPALVIGRYTVRVSLTGFRYDPPGSQVNSDFGGLALPTDEARQIELSLKFMF